MPGWMFLLRGSRRRPRRRTPSRSSRRRRSASVLAMSVSVSPALTSICTCSAVPRAVVVGGGEEAPGSCRSRTRRRRRGRRAAGGSTGARRPTCRRRPSCGLRRAATAGVGPCRPRSSNARSRSSIISSASAARRASPAGSPPRPPGRRPRVGVFPGRHARTAYGLRPRSTSSRRPAEPARARWPPPADPHTPERRRRPALAARQGHREPDHDLHRFMLLDEARELGDIGRNGVIVRVQVATSA